MILAVFLSLILLAYRASRPHFSIPGKFPGEETYGNIERYPENQQVPGKVIILPDTFLYYANATAIGDEVCKEIVGYQPSPRVILLDLEDSKRLDITSTDVMADLIQEFKDQDIELWLSPVNFEACVLLVRSGVTGMIGAEHVF